jgi:hypothetical protein
MHLYQAVCGVWYGIVYSMHVEVMKRRDVKGKEGRKGPKGYRGCGGINFISAGEK